MKKLLFVFVLAVVLMTSCDLFKSKEAKLCDKEWILYMRSTSYMRRTTPCDTCFKIEYFKKTDRKLVFTFQKEGIVYLEENYSTYEYTWMIDDQKLIITSERGDYSFTIEKISSNKLTIYYSDKNDCFNRDCFYTNDCKDWFSDEAVDGLRK